MNDGYTFEMVPAVPSSPYEGHILTRGPLDVCWACLVAAVLVWKHCGMPFEWVNQWGFQVQTPTGRFILRVTQIPDGKPSRQQ
ncbi:hypothetical protein [Nocardia ninae]|uniref:hypothetical protein n=1 Tax=Nocardia ninae TaxID=356145 RepID=UPI0011BEDFB8|nr:hypothetical protein [Nocardia ninae]